MNLILVKRSNVISTPKLKQKDELVKLFVLIDDLIIGIKSYLIESGNNVGRPSLLTDSEVITGVLFAQRQGLVTLKDIHTFLETYHRSEFPSFPSYPTFVSHYNSINYLVYLCLVILVGANRLINPVIIMIGDSTPLPVCRNIRINLHRVCKGFAERSKTTMGWFYGFKLHLLIGTNGQLLGFRITPGNVDDRKPIPDITKGLKGVFLGDAGYCSKMLEKLMPKKGIIYFTRVRNNMKKLMTRFQNQLLNLRPKVESVISILKERMNIVTSLPRSVTGHLSHYLYTLLGYEVFSRFI